MRKKRRGEAEEEDEEDEEEEEERNLFLPPGHSTLQSPFRPNTMTWGES